MKKIISLVLSLALISTCFSVPVSLAEGASYFDGEYEHYYSEFMTNDEIIEVISRIANGENVIFGDGVYQEYYYDQTDIQPFWGAPGTEATHQWIASRALTILNIDKGAEYSKYIKYDTSKIVEAADWPDADEGDWAHDCHFYYYPDKSNVWGWLYPTAKDMFLTHYYNALSYYDNAYLDKSYITRAYQELGRAIHYLSDIGTPVHTGDHYKVPDINPLQLANHVHYETYAQNNRKGYAVSSSSYYDKYATQSIGTIADTNARVSYGYYQDTWQSESSSTFLNSVKYPLQFVQMDIAGLLHKFYLDTGNLRFN